MRRFAHGVILAWGWQRWLLALGAGAIGAVAMPPFGIWPVLAVSFTVSIWLLDGSAASTGRLRLRTLFAAFLAGWWFGFGYFVAGLWWLGQAFLVEADVFGWLMPLGVVGLPAALAFFHAFAFMIARMFWPRGASRILVFAAVMALAEFARGHVLTGFPWNDFGMAFGQMAPLDQIAAFVGLPGLCLIVVATLSSPAAMGTGESADERLGPPLMGAVTIIGLAGFGFVHLAGAPLGTVPGVKLRIMQPAIAQDAKFRPENREQIMRHYLALSDRATSPDTTGIADVTHLIWPESSFPFILERDRAALTQLAAFLPDKVTLITGAARAEAPGPGETQPRFLNAIQVVDGEGQITGTYDKVHLVPFGEYLPFRELLERWGLRQFVVVPNGFTAGRSRRALTVKGLPTVAPLVCYEAIFPGAVEPPGGRVGLLLNVTNDAWFGITPGPHQHFAQARLRAVETGLPLVRAANNGISAIVDSHGRVLRSLPLGAEGVLDGPLPVTAPPTIYARFGDGIFFGMVVFALFVAWVGRRDA